MACSPLHVASQAAETFVKDKKGCYKKPECKFSLRQDLKFVVRPNIDKKLPIITCLIILSSSDQIDRI